MRYFDIKKDSLEEVISKAINEDNKPSAKELVDEGGKYLKYSDLLLQKGRLMAKNQSTAMIDKEISKEMKKLGIKEATGDIDKNYKGDHEEEVDLEEENIKVIMDKDLSNNDFQKLMKKFKLKVKETGEYNQGYAEVEISGDKRDMEKMMKVTRDSLSNYKFNSRTKTYESNNLEAKTTKNVDETLDRIREANVDKGRSMRNILADIWNMGEGKSVFDKEEKVKKEEEDEKGSSKTMTGKKATKVEIEPEVK